LQDRSEDAFRRNLALLLASTAAYGGFAAVRGWLFSLVNTNLLQRLRAQLFWRLISQPVAFFDATDTAQLTSRLAADCSVISRLFATSINVALRNALQVVRAGARGAASATWSKPTFFASRAAMHAPED
jgi:ABC-type multidrug transport system fused ATPase/permease subunit